MIGIAGSVSLRRGLAQLRTAQLTVLGWFLASRLVALAAFLGLYALGPAGYFGERLFRSPLDLLGAWDGVWYARVAAHGYLLVPHHQSDPAFFPLFPILMRGLHALGLPYAAGGALIANAAAAAATPAFYRLGRLLLPEHVAMRAAIFLALTPMGFVFSMAYPESLVLALTVFAALAALEGRWLPAAFFAALAVLTRPEGLLVSILFTAIAWRKRGGFDPGARGRALAAILAGPTALASFLLYLQWSLGDALAWSRAQELWGRSFHLSGPFHAIEHLPDLVASNPWLARDAVLAAAYLTLLALAALRTSLPREWILAGAFVLVLPLFSGTVESEGRFGLLALPVYWGAASISPSPAYERALRFGLLGLIAAGVLTLPYVWP